MAITLLSHLESVVPAYNPVVWVFNSDESSILGFRYLFNLYKYLGPTGSTTELIGTFRVAPDLNGYGQFDISKLLQSNIDSVCVNTNNTDSLIPTPLDYLSMCRYDIECIEEFPFYESFPDYEFGGYWVSFPITSSAYNVGDLVYIQLDDISITDSRAQLNGYHTVVTVTGTDIEIDVLFSSIGSGPTTPGKIYYADRRKVTGDELLEEDYQAYNAAIPFTKWPNWTSYDILPTIDEEQSGNILTNAPNFPYGNPFSVNNENSKENKFIITPTQELYWNFWDDTTGYIDTVIAIANTGERYKINCTMSPERYMKQLRVDPGASWVPISATVSGGFGNNTFLYHYEEDGSVTEIEYYDIWPTFQNGYEPCDIINVELTVQTLSGFYVENCIAYCTGQVSGRRKYNFTFLGVVYQIWYNIDWRITNPSNNIVSNMPGSAICPTETLFSFWSSWAGAYLPLGVLSISINTTAIGDDAFPTLRPHRIYLDWNCKINKAQLLFLDRQGSYSSFNMPLRIVESGNNQKLTYRNTIGDYNSDLGDWTYQTNESEITTYSSTIEKSYTLSTDWINQGMSDYFEELITSPQVWVKLEDPSQGNGFTPWLACTVVNNEFVNPKKKNKKLINRQVTIKLNSNNIINI